MLNSVVGNVILDGLFGLSATNGTAAKITFSGDIYLGLLTKLPNDNGAAHADGKLFAEPNDSSYHRIKINDESRISGNKIIGHATVGERPAISDGIPACVENQAVIMFPESTVAWDKIVGFGLFRSKTATDELPFLWGAVTTDGGEAGVSIDANEVPIIRAGGFKISLM